MRREGVLASTLVRTCQPALKEICRQMVVAKWSWSAVSSRVPRCRSEARRLREQQLYRSAATYGRRTNRARPTSFVRVTMKYICATATAH